jgi:16S rRNA (cytidine1402-2'-O)-methyltransferase
MSTLYIVATPIGNLGDISLRVLDVLKSVDLILCEDTRETQKLLSRHGIKTPTLSYHQHSRLEKVENIIRILGEGKDLALVSDAGTPGISDPGNKLIEKLVEMGPQLVQIVPLPGPSALTAAASVSGFPMDRFVFLGFPPAKKKRKKFFQDVISSVHPVIFYESPHRIIKSLKELSEFNENLEVVVCRELTKKFETVYRGKIGEVIGQINPKGEFVVIVKNK